MRRPVPAGCVLGARGDDHPKPGIGCLPHEPVHCGQALGTQVAAAHVIRAALQAVRLLDRVVPQQRDEAHDIGGRKLEPQPTDVVTGGRTVTNKPLEVHVHAAQQDWSCAAITAVQVGTAGAQPQWACLRGRPAITPRRHDRRGPGDGVVWAEGARLTLAPLAVVRLARLAPAGAARDASVVGQARNTGHIGTLREGRGARARGLGQEVEALQGHVFHGRPGGGQTRVLAAWCLALCLALQPMLAIPLGSKGPVHVCFDLGSTRVCTYTLFPPNQHQL